MTAGLLAQVRWVTAYGCGCRDRDGFVRHDQDAAVAATTVADDVRSALLADLLGRVAGCFPRRETRQCCGQMVSGLLLELEDHNCQPVAEAAGHSGPHRLQHLLSRAVWDEQHVVNIASAWAVSHLDDGDAVLIVNETADESPLPTPSAELAGTAARQAVSRCARWRSPSLRLGDAQGDQRRNSRAAANGGGSRLRITMGGVNLA